MEIPKAIQKAARGLMRDVPGSSVSYLGVYNGSDAYAWTAPDDKKVGYPVVFLYKNAVITKVISDEALDIISLLS